MGAQWMAEHNDLAANAKGRLFGKMPMGIMIAARHGADPAGPDLVSRALPAQGFSGLSAELRYKPKRPLDPARLNAEQIDEVDMLLATRAANEDVQNVFAGLRGRAPLPDEEGRCR